MAKKKEAFASPLVPVEEQPYKIPDNWCWVKLEDISEIIMGQSPIGSNTTDDSSYMPLIGGAADMGIMYPLATRYTKVPTKVSENGDLIVCIRATLGKPIFSDGEYCLGRGVAAVRPYIGPKEFYRYFFLNFEQYLYDNATGTTFAQVSSKILQKMPVPCSPLPEQQRIVDRIESMFAKLDEAKEKAQAVVDGFELRKSAILHKAFTGELTERWRKEHGIGRESWEIKTIGEVFEAFSGKGFKEKEYSPSGIKLLRISNVTYDALIWDDTKYLPYEYVNLVPELVLKEDDIVMALNRPITNEKLKISVVNSTEPIILYQRVGCLRKKHDYQVDYLRFALESRDFLTQVRSNLQGSDQPYINLPPLKKLTIPVCQHKEQIEIVRILNKVLGREQQAKEAAEAVLTQIDTMKKTILARAFRGELGTNDPAEEWAGELVKSVL